LWGHSHTAAKAEDRIEHRADRTGEWQSIEHGHRRPGSPSAAKEARAICLELQIAGCVAFDDSKMRSPGLGISRRSLTSSRQKRAGIRNELGLYMFDDRPNLDRGA
jgi:hypothetical protein